MASVELKASGDRFVWAGLRNGYLEMGASSNLTLTSYSFELWIKRGSLEIGYFKLTATTDSGIGNAMYLPISSVYVFERPPAGSHTYSIEGLVTVAGTGLAAAWADLQFFEHFEAREFLI